MHAGQVVTVGTRRFDPGTLVEVSMCLAPDATVDVPRCDDSTIRSGTVDGKGRFSLRYRLRTDIRAGRFLVDCTDAAGRCVLRASPDGGVTVALAPLTFA